MSQSSVMGKTICVDKAGVISNRPLLTNRQVWQLRLSAPDIAARVQPGQFIHLQIPGFAQHILRRPFSIYDANAATGEIDIVYQLVGVGSRQMTQLSTGDDRVSLIGPIGRGWHPPAAARRLLLVGGGVGIAPLYLLAKQLIEKGQGGAVEVVIGAQNTNMIVCKHDIAGLLPSGSLHITTDDGSEGICGFTTAATEPLLATGSFDYLACCGPEPMQKATAALATQYALACEVSLERRMACGIGACLSCVVPTSRGSKRACVDGPVFNAQELMW